MKTPEVVTEILHKRFRNQRDTWLAGGGQWPLVINLGVPAEARAQQQLAAVRDWLQRWRDCPECAAHPEVLQWCERSWRTLGRQRLPEKLSFPDADSVAAWCGQLEPWQRVRKLREKIHSLWPQAELPPLYSALSAMDEGDFEALLRGLQWLQEHPRSNLYLRQLPIEGLDSKWIERHRKLLIALLGTVDGREYSGDFADFLGLRKASPRVRLRLLDRELQLRLRGLEDLEMPVPQLRLLDLPVKNVFIVENLATFLAFEPLAESAVVFGRGFGVGVLAGLPWLHRARCYYWGDIDSDGFAILNRIRTYYPEIQSLMMDRHTLECHRDLCVRDPNAGSGAQLERLTAAEQNLYREVGDRRLRLEQERIAWPHAWGRIKQCLDGGGR